MKKNKKVLLILIPIIVLLIGLIVGGVVIINNNDKSKVPNTPEPAPELTEKDLFATELVLKDNYEIEVGFDLSTISWLDLVANSADLTEEDKTKFTGASFEDVKVNEAGEYSYSLKYDNKSYEGKITVKAKEVVEEPKEEEEKPVIKPEETKPVATLSLSYSYGTIYVGKTVTLNIKGSNYGTLSCKSSNTTVATCEISGTKLLITPKKAGSATITVNSTSGKSASYKATVAVKQETTTEKPKEEPKEENTTGNTGNTGNTGTTTPDNNTGNNAGNTGSTDSGNTSTENTVTDKDKYYDEEVPTSWCPPSKTVNGTGITLTSDGNCGGVLTHTASGTTAKVKWSCVEIYGGHICHANLANAPKVNSTILYVGDPGQYEKGKNPRVGSYANYAHKDYPLMKKDNEWDCLISATPLSEKEAYYGVKITKPSYISKEPGDVRELNKVWGNWFGKNDYKEAGKFIHYFYTTNPSFGYAGLVVMIGNNPEGCMGRDECVTWEQYFFE